MKEVTGVVLMMQLEAASLHMREAGQSHRDSNRFIVAQSRICAVRLDADAWGLQHI